MERREFLLGTAALALLSKVVPAETTSRGAVSAKPEAPKVGTGPARLNVRDDPFAAKGDGTRKDTLAFQTALDRCGVLGGGEVLVPAGQYLIGSIQLRTNTLLRLSEGAVLMGSPDMADYAVTAVRWEGRWIPGHIGLVNAIDARGVGMAGPGKIAGNETLGGRPTKEKPLRHPALVEFIRCDGVFLQGFSTSYARMWNVHPSNCTNVWIEGLTIRSNTGNGDGIDVDSCKHVHIARCDIATGDDCISLKSGRGLEGFTLKQVTEDVTIEDCTFSDNIFACIGIGSETSGGIKNVRVRRCKFTGAKTFALYIKSRPGRGAVIEDLLFDDLDVSGTYGGGFLRFNLLASGLLGDDPVPGLEGIPQGRNFVFRNVRIASDAVVPVLVDGAGIHPDKPLERLVLENISGPCQKGITLANARRVILKNVTVTGFEGSLLSTLNVTGVGLAGAAKAEALKMPEPVAARETPYRLE
jgi:polygalacturonase